MKIRDSLRGVCSSIIKYTLLMISCFHYIVSIFYIVSFYFPYFLFYQFDPAVCLNLWLNVHDLQIYRIYKYARYGRQNCSSRYFGRNRILRQLLISSRVANPDWTIEKNPDLREKSVPDPFLEKNPGSGSYLILT